MQFEARFVRVEIDRAGTAWGLLVDAVNEFRPLWADDMDAVRAELGPDVNELTPAEMKTVEDADESNTPDEAWAVLAKWRLTGG